MLSRAQTVLKYSSPKRESSLTWASHAGVEGPQRRSAWRLMRRRTTVTKKNICLLWNQGTLSNSASSLVSINLLLSAGNISTYWRRTRNRPPDSGGRGAGPSLYYLTAQAYGTRASLKTEWIHISRISPKRQTLYFFLTHWFVFLMSSVIWCFKYHV